MPLPTLVSPNTQFEYNAGSVSTKTQVQANAVAAGDVICIGVMWETGSGAAANLTLTDTLGNSYAKVVDITGGVTLQGITSWEACIFWTKAQSSCAANANTVTLTWASGTTVHYTITILEVNGVNAFDVANGGSGTGTMGPTTLVTSYPNEAICAFGTSNSASGFGGGVTFVSGSITLWFPAFGTEATAGTYNPDIVNIGSQNWNIGAAAFYLQTAIFTTDPPRVVGVFAG